MDNSGRSIFNLYDNFEYAGNNILCSLGIHPWYIDEGNFEAQLSDLRKWAMLSNVIAIGECGLDKLAKTDWIIQIEAFTAQVALANELNKPLIIHCVRAYDEVLQLLRSQNVKVPAIFHGFNKNIQLAQRLLSAGYYMSFGAALLKENSNATKVIGSVPIDRVFLETDNKDIPIAKVYERAASFLKTDTDTLILQLQNNFKAVFKI